MEFINVTRSLKKLLEKTSQNKYTPKLPVLPLLSSCSVAEDSAVRLCICVQPGKRGTMPILAFISTAVSSFKCEDSIRTLQLLQIVNMVISAEILPLRQKHRPGLTAPGIFCFRAPTTGTRTKPPKESYVPNFHNAGPRASCKCRAF